MTFSSQNNLDIKAKLRDEALRLRDKYDVSSLADLERLAKEEYGVREVVRTPLAYKCPVTIGSRSCASHIFYYSLSREVERSSLAHEIGHVVAGHQTNRKNLSGIEEDEANYFAKELRGISSLRQNLTLFLGGSLAVPLTFVVPFIRISEEIKLKARGISDDIIAMI
ncbi:ImmA/IrrE family metallo-endopeptidase [Candidatus Pacearchaeota archaeon]|nr:ImmA/IrrE family metallo-endopeptidase [Candidatus Pacearchaeota archaeon]